MDSILIFSTIDWHMHTSFMICCAGCNFHCPFCSDSASIPLNSGANNAISLIGNRILENIGSLEGLGFTEEEPSLQSKPIIELYIWAKNIS